MRPGLAVRPGLVQCLPGDLVLAERGVKSFHQSDWRCPWHPKWLSSVSRDVDHIQTTCRQLRLLSIQSAAAAQPQVSKKSPSQDQTQLMAVQTNDPLVDLLQLHQSDSTPGRSDSTPRWGSRPQGSRRRHGRGTSAPPAPSALKMALRGRDSNGATNGEASRLERSDRKRRTGAPGLTTNRAIGRYHRNGASESQPVFPARPCGQKAPLVASLFLVVRPGAPNSFLAPFVAPFAPSSVLVGSDRLCW